MGIKPLVRIPSQNFSFPDPAPGGYEANTATIVDSSRNLQGYVVGAIIRNDVAKISLSWNFLTPEMWAEILKCFNPKFGGNFYNYVEFYNQDTADWETRLMYVSDRNAGMWLRDPETGTVRGWKNPKLSLIEV